MIDTLIRMQTYMFLNLKSDEIINSYIFFILKIGLLHIQISLHY
jgi:hypothetical protein